MESPNVKIQLSHYVQMTNDKESQEKVEVEAKVKIKAK